MKLRYLGTVVALVTLGMTAPASAEQSEAEIARIKTTNECFQGFQDKNYEVSQETSLYIFIYLFFVFT